MTNLTDRLTPFDNGTRLEPRPWVRKAGGTWFAGSDPVRRADDDDFGRVDFDNDEGGTVCVVYVEPIADPRGDDGYTVKIETVTDVELLAPYVELDGVNYYPEGSPVTLSAIDLDAARQALGELDALIGGAKPGVLDYGNLRTVLAQVVGA